MSGKSWDALLRRQVMETIRPYPLTPPSAKIIVGVSGGPDSLALLHLLRRLCGSEWLVAAHVQHGLRPSALAEAEFVKNTAAAWSIPYVERHVDVAQFARQSGMTIEEAGRYARYRFFAETARQYGAEAVAVGHNADDQAETVLMNLLRGSGLAGLGGMRPVGQVLDTEELILLRPLLQTSRADIEAYCAANQLQPREDESNADVSYHRNRIRHQLLPLLRAFNPQIKAHLGQLSQMVQADYDLLQKLFQEQWPQLVAEQGAGWLALRRAAWQDLPVSWQRLALRRAVLALLPSQTEIGFRAIEQARELALQDASGAKAHLPGEVSLTVGYERLFFALRDTAVPLDAPQISEGVPLPVPGRVHLSNGWVLETAVAPNPDLQTIQNNPDPWTAYVTEETAGSLFVRPRQPGERFQPLGMDGRSAKLKDVMINRKIPRELRSYWPIVANEKHIVWLVGQQIDERVRVTAVSRTIWKMRCYRDGE